MPAESRSKKMGNGPETLRSPIIVGKAECDPIDTRELYVVLAGSLRDSIARIDGVDRMIEPDRLLDWFGPIAECCLEVDQP